MLKIGQNWGKIANYPPNAQQRSTLMSRSVRDIVDRKTFLLGSQKVADLRYGLQILRSCELAVAEFKIYEVADLRLRTSRITKLWTCGCGFKNQETSLRTKRLNVQLRTCGCG